MSGSTAKGTAVRIGKLVIIGVGLIGGSFALSLRRAGQVGQVVGVGRSRENLERALELGVIDSWVQDAAVAVQDADMVLVATPVGQMAQVFATIAPVLPPGAIVTDAGSTKCDVVALMRQHLPRQLSRCVPAHPIAGSELSGAAAAQFALFENRTVVLAPLPETDDEAVACVRAAWQVTGASVACLRPEQHDAIFATVSHLPHLLAFAYVDTVLARPDARQCFDFASTGFRDFTRIAGSHPEMWRDITLANQAALLAELDAFSATLAQLRAEVAAADAGALEARFARARSARTAWAERFNRR
ncbi:prephenate dehydrogenase/arogenate dehydrogenase family protein [Laribacter hongkongensis]|nr:prephenate dehydrogenase/arogenate dehydrogenase family protein [Laribacter hongkongensis]